MNFFIGADIVPTDTNNELFLSGDVNNLVGKGIADVLYDADYRILNLEVPLVDISSPILKRGPNLIAHPETVKAIKKMKVDLLTLGNNHIMDQGEKGLFNTIGILKDAGIDFVGAGTDINDAGKPFVIQKDDIKIGVIACCEHEFSIADCNKPGANPYDPLTTFDDIYTLKSNNDFVFVLYHGGKEEYRYPSPELQKRCRKMIEKGADLVICQHTHCIGCEEDYLNGKIIYGQGNFIFDLKDNEFWNNSLGIICNINGDKEITYSYIPITKKNHVIRLAEGPLSQMILNGYWERTRDIKIPGNIEKFYSEYASKKANDYLSCGFGIFRSSLIGKVINRITNKRIWNLFLGTNDYLAVINNLECESHYELYRYAVHDKLKRNESKKMRQPK